MAQTVQNGTSTEVASVKNQPHILVQCESFSGSRQNSKNLLLVVICKSFLRVLYICIYIYIYVVPLNMVCHLFNLRISILVKWVKYTSIPWGMPSVNPLILYTPFLLLFELVGTLDVFISANYSGFSIWGAQAITPFGVLRPSEPAGSASSAGFGPTLTVLRRPVVGSKTSVSSSVSASLRSFAASVTSAKAPSPVRASTMKGQLICAPKKPSCISPPNTKLKHRMTPHVNFFQQAAKER